MEATASTPGAEAIFGPWMIVVVLSWTLWGVLTLQVFKYYFEYKRDRPLLKGLVAVVWIADTAHKIMLFSGVYRCLIINFGMTSSVDDLALISGETAPRVLVTILVQGFCFSRVHKFARRSFSAARSSLVLFIYALSALLQIGFTVSCLIVTFTATVPSDFGSSVMTISAPGYLGTALGTDVTMATMMTYLLYTEYRKEHYQGTSSMLRRLCYFSVNTGTWTAIFALLTLVLYELRPSENWWAIFDFGVCGVYSNTLLANLNARSYLGGDGSVTFTLNQSGTSGAMRSGLPPVSTGYNSTGRLAAKYGDTQTSATDESVTPRDVFTFVTAKEEQSSQGHV
ncbi:hypothetical protein BD626DRAFT_496422 [Schizophyllum amplum]|uniref:DUF6534 domain-containing protein n=1 Tax=Schizophyllum amplum TaxID=97359 RepID=A0A550CDK4_9AGAR|nr:hypothetical protein BD626DRAFT_496422 [Auriculariopsis ampla]